MRARNATPAIWSQSLRAAALHRNARAHTHRSLRSVTWLRYRRRKITIHHRRTHRVHLLWYILQCRNSPRSGSIVRRFPEKNIAVRNKLQIKTLFIVLVFAVCSFLQIRTWCVCCDSFVRFRGIFGPTDVFYWEGKHALHRHSLQFFEEVYKLTLKIAESGNRSTQEFLEWREWMS